MQECSAKYLMKKNLKEQGLKAKLTSLSNDSLGYYIENPYTR